MKIFSDLRAVGTSLIGGVIAVIISRVFDMTMITVTTDQKTSQKHRL